MQLTSKDKTGTRVGTESRAPLGVVGLGVVGTGVCKTHFSAQPTRLPAKSLQLDKVPPCVTAADVARQPHALAFGPQKGEQVGGKHVRKVGRQPTFICREDEYLSTAMSVINFVLLLIARPIYLGMYHGSPALDGSLLVILHRRMEI